MSGDDGLRSAIEPCKECHSELHRAQCWEGGCVATRDELREAILDVLRLYGIRGEALGSLRPQSVADALLALPEVAALRAKASADRAYEEGAADALWGATAELMPHETVTVAYLRAESDRYRAALDGPAPC